MSNNLIPWNQSYTLNQHRKEEVFMRCHKSLQSFFVICILLGSCSTYKQPLLNNNMKSNTKCMEDWKEDPGGCKGLRDIVCAVQITSVLQHDKPSYSELLKMLGLPDSTSIDKNGNKTCVYVYEGTCTDNLFRYDYQYNMFCVQYNSSGLFVKVYPERQKTSVENCLQDWKDDPKGCKDLRKAGCAFTIASLLREKAKSYSEIINMIGKPDSIAMMSDKVKRCIYYYSGACRNEVFQPDKNDHCTLEVFFDSSDMMEKVTGMCQ